MSITRFQHPRKEVSLVDDWWRLFFCHPLKVGGRGSTSTVIVGNIHRNGEALGLLPESL